MADLGKDPGMKGFLSKAAQKKAAAGAAGEGKPTANPDRVDGAPRVDISLPKTQRRKFSITRANAKIQVIKELPLLSETPMLKREVSFLSFSCVICKCFVLIFFFVWYYWHFVMVFFLFRHYFVKNCSNVA